MTIVMSRMKLSVRVPLLSACSRAHSEPFRAHILMHETGRTSGGHSGACSVLIHASGHGSNWHIGCHGHQRDVLYLCLHPSL